MSTEKRRHERLAFQGTIFIELLARGMGGLQKTMTNKTRTAHWSRLKLLPFIFGKSLQTETQAFRLFL